MKSPSSVPIQKTIAKQRIRDAVLVAESSQAWYGTWMLFRRELMRFLTILGQTIISPVISTLLYFSVFGLSLGQRIDTVQGIPYMDYLVPGLVMMSLLMNAFFNSAFSFFLGKIHGTIVDLLASPIGPGQIMLAYIAAAIVRGMLTGGTIWLISAFLGAETLHAPWVTIFFMLGASYCFGLLGLTISIFAKEFEHVNFVPSFVLMPLTFLGGVFYSISMLPETWAMISRFNPVLYIINGIRYGMIGISDVPVWQGVLFLTGFGFLLSLYTLKLLKSGKKLRD